MSKSGRFDRSPKNTMNICIMAHVDHGKTTLADALVASNGIINQRQAGKIRYMDSRKDEIERGITMKSSCVTLTYLKDSTCYIVNLIDSPGHVDFSSEVSTAVRLCDGTIIVVDVVEGVCAQTKVVLRQAWCENIRPILVLNKIDRLILEMKLDAIDAYYHIQHVLEQVNAYMGELYNTEVLLKSTIGFQERKQQAVGYRKHRMSETYRLSESSDMFSNWSVQDVDDSDLYFMPEKGNVVFSSAYDGWGFRLADFAQLFSEKVGIDAVTLTNSLWGDFHISSKGGKKCVLGNAREKNKPPLFVSMILENIFKVYQTLIIRKDLETSVKISKLLGVSLPPSILRSTDLKARLQYILSTWLPLSSAVLEMVVSKLPSAAELSAERVTKLMCSATQRFESLPTKTKELKEAFLSARSEDCPLIVFVSKMFSVDKSCINDRGIANKESSTTDLGDNRYGSLSEDEVRAKREEVRAKAIAQDRGCSSDRENIKSDYDSEGSIEQDENLLYEEVLVAFARVFSGTLRVGQKVYVLGAKHSPNYVVNMTNGDVGEVSKNPSLFEHIKMVEVGSIFLLMGRQLEKVSHAPCGSIVGIGGIDDAVIKSATLSSTPLCPSFTDLTLQATPILRVAVEPERHKDLKKLREGLKILNQADPCVEVSLEDSGEYVIVTAGEVHLERCISDLQERYARVPVSTSPPIVAFRETIIEKPKMDMLNEIIEGENVIEGRGARIFDGTHSVVNIAGKLKVTVKALPESITKFLEDNSDLLQTITELASKDCNPGQIEKDITCEASCADLKFSEDDDNLHFEHSVGEVVVASRIECKRSDQESLNLESLKNDQESPCDKNAGEIVQEVGKDPDSGDCVISGEINSDVEEKNKTSSRTGSAINDITSSKTNLISEINREVICESNLQFSGGTISKMRVETISENNSKLNRESSKDVTDKISSELQEKITSVDSVATSNEKIFCGEKSSVINCDTFSKSKESSGLPGFIADNVISDEALDSIAAFKNRLDALFKESGVEWEGIIDKIWSFGPNFKGPNILVNNVKNYDRPSIFENRKRKDVTTSLAQYDTNFIMGFQMATKAGPLCEEPTMGVCFFVDEWEVNSEVEATSSGSLSGQIISMVKDSLRKAFENSHQRLLVAMYSCIINVTSDVVGKVYNVIGKRHGRITHGDITEGSTSWNVTAYLPVIESINFANDLRKASSGEAMPQLVFSHWELIEIDPFWVPQTTEELTLWGEKADSENLARKYINMVRKRKGLPTDEKIVQFAEKQRNLSKNK